MEYPGRGDTLFAYLFTITFFVLSVDRFNISALFSGACLFLFPIIVFRVNQPTARMLAFTGLVISSVLFLVRIYE